MIFIKQTNNKKSYIITNEAIKNLFYIENEFSSNAKPTIITHLNSYKKETFFDDISIYRKLSTEYKPTIVFQANNRFKFKKE